MSQEGNLCSLKEVIDASYSVPLLSEHRWGECAKYVTVVSLTQIGFVLLPKMKWGEKEAACFRNSIALQKLRTSISILPCSLYDLGKITMKEDDI